jgi:hypothetical protein
MKRPVSLLVLAVTVGSASAQDEPEYPLGKLRPGSVTEPADPLRLVDLRFAFTRDGSTLSSFEARLKLGATAFFGGEVRGERLGAFFDTQRMELGVSEEEGYYNIEASYRAPFFIVGLDAEKRPNDTWNLAGDGSLRLSTDWEILLAYQYDTDDSRGGPPSLEDFIETGRLPPPDRPTHVLRSGSVGFLYQKETVLELGGEASVSEVRTEAGFDQTRSRLGASVVWNRSRLEVDGRVFVDRLTGRLARREALAELGAAFRFAGYFVLTGRTLQEWQPGVERSIRHYGGGLTFFGRRFRFARSSEVADHVLRLARRANELGYNERRVYDLEGLRAFRERLSISAAREELAGAIDALYRAQVRERNVPQLGLELATTVDQIGGSQIDSYRAFLGVPWRIAWPFTRGEERVEFVRIDYVLRNRWIPSLGNDSRSHELSVSVELNREHFVHFRWEHPGQTPEQVVSGIRPGRRIHFEYVYALGR